MNHKKTKQTKTIIKTTLIILTLIIISTTLLPPNQTTPLTTAAATATTTKNTVTGQGANTNATLIITDYNTNPGQADTQNGFNIPCPQNWGILNTTLTINNITAPNATIKIGERPGEIGSRLIYTIQFMCAASFTISTESAKLYNVSVYIDVHRPPSPPDKNLVAEICNATWDANNQRPTVGDNIYTAYVLINSTFRGWVTFDFSSSPTLNSSDTVNNTFFIVLRGGQFSTLICYWLYVADDETYDESYSYTYMGSWSFESIDFRMRLVLDPGPVYPSEVGLRVNRTDVGSFVVEDVPGQRGNGTCTIIGPTPPSQDGYVHFNASANWGGTVYFNVTQANSAVYRDVEAGTVYVASPGQPVNWNVTVDATGDQGFPEVGAGKFINVSIPADWWNLTEGALNISNNEVSTYLINASGMLLFEATNGTWVVQCGGPNVLSSFSVYSLYDGMEVNVGGAVVSDNLSVRGVLSRSLSGNVNLTVLSSGSPVFSVQASFSGGVAEVGWTSVSVAPGDYTLRLLVEGGLEVGLLEKPFTISARAPCNIRIDRLESTDKVKILLYVSRNDTGFPVTDAQISVYYANGIRIQPDDVVNYGNGSYFVAFTPPGEEAYTFNIEVSGARIETASTVVEVSYRPPPLSPEVVGLVLAAVLQSERSAQSWRLLAALGVSSAAVVAGGVTGGMAYRRWRAPVRAMSSMENVLVAHKETGLPLWSFDLLSLDVDATLVSGFVSAVRNFAEEMRLGGFNMLETRIGTFVRAESELLDVVCVAGRVGRLEVEWLRSRLGEFLRLVEAEAASALRKWEGGDVSEFRDVFRRAFTSTFDYPRLVRLHEARMKRLLKERGRIVGAIAFLEEEARRAAEMFERGELSAEEYERQVSELSRDKEALEQRVASIDDTLSRMRVRELIITGKVEKARERFNEIRVEIEELRKKEERGELTEKEKKRLRSLEKDLRKLVDELSKIDEGGS
ncbi:MAG: hypothetical protein KIH01_07685 [Candidatus Freyarchaeota archaeon]|nr:hypothetical protein [Candidatus Jordarchaeia archaeon]